MEREEALFSTLAELSRKLSEVDKHTAVHAEKMSQVESHLKTMNGRIAKSEDRLSILEKIRAEMAGGWKVISAMSAAIGAVASWLIQHWPK
jgi:chromosome segregation ATPase